MSDELRSTSIIDFVELQGMGLRASSIVALTEMGALGLYGTSMVVLVEFELNVIDRYAIASGHNIPAGFLAKLTPQLTTPGLLVTRRTHSPNRHVRDEFLYTYHLYNALGSVAQYRAVLAQYGVLDALEHEVTVTAYDQTYGWQRYNATAVQPEQGVDVQYRMPFPRSVQILLKYMELAN